MCLQKVFMSLCICVLYNCIYSVSVGLPVEDNDLKVMGYSLQLRMRGARLRFTVNSEMCARLWRQFFYR